MGSYVQVALELIGMYFLISITGIASGVLIVIGKLSEVVINNINPVTRSKIMNPICNYYVYVIPTLSILK